MTIRLVSLARFRFLFFILLCFFLLRIPDVGFAVPSQFVSLDVTSGSLSEGESFTVFVIYDAYDTDQPATPLKTNGVGIRVFFDDRLISYTGYSNILSTSNPFIARADDVRDLDGNPDTTELIQMNWYDFSGTNWPEGVLPKILVELSFTCAAKGNTDIGADIYVHTLQPSATGVSLTIGGSLHGDYNCDGTLDIADAVSVLGALSKVSAPPAGCSPLKGDFDGNGRIESGDAAGILQAVAGLIK